MRSFIAMLCLCIGLIIASTELSAMPEQSSDVIHKATFAGGCFWCMQPSFDNAEGVIDATVGYTGGTAETASYAQITSKTTKHV